MCADLIHVTHHHITTPYFVRQDLQDLLIGGNFVETGFGDWDDFGQKVYDQLVKLPKLDSFAAAAAGRLSVYRTRTCADVSIRFVVPPSGGF
jgi:hypothetical protein